MFANEKFKPFIFIVISQNTNLDDNRKAFSKSFMCRIHITTRKLIVGRYQNQKNKKVKT